MEKLCKREQLVLRALQSGEHTRNSIGNSLHFDPQSELKHLISKSLITSRREHSPRWGFTGYRTLYKLNENNKLARELKTA